MMLLNVISVLISVLVILALFCHLIYGLYEYNFDIVTNVYFVLLHVVIIVSVFVSWGSAF